jgi:ketosteroid isomerase-like protein
MRRWPFLLLLLVAVPAAALSPASDRAAVERLLRGVVTALNQKDAAAVARLTWPDGHYGVTRLPRGERPDWARMRWQDIGFPGDISYRATVSDVRVEVRGDRATAQARVVGLCYRGEIFTGVRMEASNRVEAERRRGEWRIRDWARDVRRVGEGNC